MIFLRYSSTDRKQLHWMLIHYASNIHAEKRRSVIWVFVVSCLSVIFWWFIEERIMSVCGITAFEGGIEVVVVVLLSLSSCKQELKTHLSGQWRTPPAPLWRRGNCAAAAAAAVGYQKWRGWLTDLRPYSRRQIHNERLICIAACEQFDYCRLQSNVAR